MVTRTRYDRVPGDDNAGNHTTVGSRHAINGLPADRSAHDVA
jgi:hypothetical protein